MSGSSRSSSGHGPVHRPVLLREVLQQLDLAPGLRVLDGTVGAAGHSEHIWKRIQAGGTLIGLDRDPLMLGHAYDKLNKPDVQTGVFLRHRSYAEAADVLEELGLENVDRVLLDLGLSSDQLADDARGFSFDATGPLDMRFDVTQGISAAKFLATQPVETLEQTFSEFGEERFSRRIAEAIVRQRDETPIETAADLCTVTASAVPGAARRDARKHPATRVFQALRIVVNHEFEHLQSGLENMLPAVVAAGGRAAVISFHSLEDRLVKNIFRDAEIWQNLTSKPLTASPAEQRLNPRSRTAKLRVAVRR